MIRTESPDLILADLLVECPGAPMALIQRSLMRAVRRFSDSCMLETWVEIPTQNNVQHYPFERYLPKGYSVSYVTEVMYNQCCIPCLEEDCNQHCSSGFTLDDMTQITLVGYCPSSDPRDPTCKDTLKVKVVLKPNADACEIPSDMINRFEEELKDGALANLLTMKNKDWTDFRAGEFYENRFEGGLASAKCLVGNKMNPRDHVIPGERLM